MDSDIMVLSVGDLTTNKNHAVLVRAMALLPEKYVLVIAGDGPERARLMELARKMGVTSRVRLLGFRDDVPSLMQACDVFCLPSKREGLPVALVEAMASGKPCVSSDARGCRELMVDAGEMVDRFSDDLAALARSLERSAQAASAERLLDRPRDYSARAAVHAHEAIYKSIA